MLLTNATAVGADVILEESNTLILGNNANVGIGTSKPTEKLEVVGNVKASNFLNSSDARLKERVKPVLNSMEIVRKLNPVSYFWNTEGVKQGGNANVEQIGFIAQELEKILPNVVNTNSEGFKSADYTKIIPVLTKAIQEQQTQIEKQQFEVEMYKSQNEEFKKRLEDLEAKLK